ncbi:MAG: hypothetical protein R3F20_10975 [Planctomycetota bacterium]
MSPRRGRGGPLLVTAAPALAVGAAVALGAGDPDLPGAAGWVTLAVGQLALALGLLGALELEGRLRRVLAAGLVAGVAVGGVAAFLGRLDDRDLLLDVAVLSAAWGAFVLAARIGLGWALGPRIGLVLSLFVVSAAFFAPFATDPWVQEHQRDWSGRELLSSAQALSPVSLGASAVLGLDLFKTEELYRRFRLGEQPVAPPSMEEGRRLLVAGALVFLAAGALLGVVRHRLGRLRGVSPDQDPPRP